MHRKYVLMASVLAWFAVAAMAQDTLEGVEAKVREAWAKNKSVTADVAIEANVPLGQTRLLLTGGGTMACLNDGGKEKYRQEVTVKMPEPMKLELKADIIFDGADLYLTTDAFGKKQSEKAKLDLLKGAVPPGGGMLFDVIKPQMNLSVKPEAQVNGKAAYVLEATPKDTSNKEVPVGNALLYIDKELGMMVKMEVNETTGTKLATVNYAGIKLNPDVPAGLFVYVPPAVPQPAPAATAPAQPAAEAKPAQAAQPAPVQKAESK